MEEVRIITISEYIKQLDEAAKKLFPKGSAVIDSYEGNDVIIKITLEEIAIRVCLNYQRKSVTDIHGACVYQWYPGTTKLISSEGEEVWISPEILYTQVKPYLNSVNDLLSYNVYIIGISLS